MTYLNLLLTLCLCIVGTSAYAPPELFIKGKYKAGPTTVWQLGAVLFELLDGDKQFTTSEYLCDKIKLNQELSQGRMMPCQHSI